MISEEIEYTENFERTTENPEHVYYAVCEAHPSDLGWVIGKPVIEKIDDKNYRIVIPLTKYKVKNRSI